MNIAILIFATIMTMAPLCICAFGRWRRHRQLPDLRGDWWTSFEQQFREYAGRSSHDHHQTA